MPEKSTFSILSEYLQTNVEFETHLHRKKLNIHFPALLFVISSLPFLGRFYPETCSLVSHHHLYLFGPIFGFWCDHQPDKEMRFLGLCFFWGFSKIFLYKVKVLSLLPSVLFFKSLLWFVLRGYIYGFSENSKIESS